MLLLFADSFAMYLKTFIKKNLAMNNIKTSMLIAALAVCSITLKAQNN